MEPHLTQQTSLTSLPHSHTSVGLLAGSQGQSKVLLISQSSLKVSGSMTTATPALSLRVNTWQKVSSEISNFPFGLIAVYGKWQLTGDTGILLCVELSIYSAPKEAIWFCVCIQNNSESLRRKSQHHSRL